MRSTLLPSGSRSRLGSHHLSIHKLKIFDAPAERSLPPLSLFLSAPWYAWPVKAPPSAWNHPSLRHYLSGVFPGSRGVRLVEGAKQFFPAEYPDLIAEEARMLWGAG